VYRTSIRCIIRRVVDFGVVCDYRRLFISAYSLHGVILATIRFILQIIFTICCPLCLGIYLRDYSFTFLSMLFMPFNSQNLRQNCHFVHVDSGLVFDICNWIFVMFFYFCKVDGSLICLIYAHSHDFSCSVVEEKLLLSS
jgi:hypothetical protein